MKKNQTLYFIIAVLIGFASCEKDSFEATHTLGLEDKLPLPDSTWVGDTTGTIVYETETEKKYFNQFDDDFFVFDNYYTVRTTGNSWSGFAITNGTDTKTEEYTNNSAIVGKGIDGKVYLTANNGFSNSAKISFKDKKARKIKGMYVTNTTYAYKVIKNGNRFSRKFTDNDWFKLKVIALDENNERKDSTVIYLADFRNGKSKILNKWKWVNTEKMGKVNALIFDLSSTDNGEWGMNTPAYFCIDGIKAVK